MSIDNNKKQSSSAQGRLGTIGVLVNYGIAHVVPGAGVKRLISTIDSPNEDASMAAYMALVKLGSKNAARIVKEAREGRKTASLLQLLGDLGEPSVIPDLEEFAQSPDTKIASAARESIAVLKGDEP